MKIFFILTILFLQNCVSLKDKQNQDFINNFPENKKSIIFFKINSKYPKTIWCKYSKKDEIIKNDCVKFKSSNYYQIAIVEGAIYEVRGYETGSRFSYEKSINPKFSNNERKTKPEIAFEAIAGKISFLGEINFRNSKIMQEKTHDEEFLEIKSAFENQDLKKLENIFKNNKFEAKILNEKINSLKLTLIDDKILSKEDFKTEKPKKEKKAKAKTKKSSKKVKKKYDI